MSRLTINSNIASLGTQRYFGNATRTLNDSFTRLSSGLRINKASDDAAGLSVSSLLTADKRVTNQAIRNINDGISYLNVAEGAIDELINIVGRIQELAEQASNGTLGSDQRSAMQSEVSALTEEYNRIIKITSFNGNQLLTGLNTNTILQGGYGLDGQLATQIGDASLGVASDLTRAGETTLGSSSSSGVIGNNSSEEASISADGRYLVFQSISTNLVTGDSNGQQDIFRKDLITGEIILVNTASNGTQASGSSNGASISADGRYVVFSSSASNLVSGDTNGQQDIFRKDLLTGEIIIVSTASDGTQGGANSNGASISADGRYVVFQSNSSNLVSGDTNGVEDIFRKDLLTGETVRVSTTSNGSQAGSSSDSAKISADGRYVVFRSAAGHLVTGDTNLASDIFRKDLLTGKLIRVSTASNGTQGNANATNANISSDGRYVVFESIASNLVSGDTNGQTDIFRKDILTGETILVSSDSNGIQGTSGSDTASISADGRYVVFTSGASNLVSGDTNGDQDIFKKDLITGEIIRVSLANNGDQGDSYSYSASISADGRYVVFTSGATNLVSGDTNGANDILLRDTSTAGVQELSGIVVTNQASARVSLDLTKRYQEELSGYKAGLGASISRAITFINTLQVQSENYAAASSQITDVDVAEESSRLAAAQILQEAAAGVLSQANLQPQLVLQLLEGI